jgi:hypothetical protein
MTTPAPGIEQVELAKAMALIAATLYQELLDVPVRAASRPDVVQFTEKQAFALVETMFYQAIKDEEFI